MVKVTIDGQVFEVDPKLTVIQAAEQNGIAIPHFCWHPKLSVSGNCRMCLVEIEKMPKLAISCATPVADGMVVKTASDRVLRARQAVMEFLLINHPLDCPICDEAGECKLQDYAYQHSVGVSRFDFAKVRKPKRVELGPHVMLDVERCIMCSRCIRFCSEVADRPQLTFTQRGDHVVLTTAPGEVLDNPYSMNTIDLCPVGALTSKEFRFKSRVWEMSSTESVCVGCSRGCNTKIWVRNNEILRLTPRHNPDVNDHWMCDHGRVATFAPVNAGNRIGTPMIGRDGTPVGVGWDEALARVASELKTYKRHELAGLGSPFATNEDNYLFMKFMHQLGVLNIDMREYLVPELQDGLLIRADRTPNATGAREVGVRPQPGGFELKYMLDSIKAGKIRALYCLEDPGLAEPAILEIFSKLDLLIVHATNESALTKQADIVLPAATYAEKHGTFVNFQRHVQRIRPAVATTEQDRALDGFAMSRWDKFGAHNDRWTKGVKRDARPSWRIITTVANALGARWKYASAEEVFTDITGSLDSFKGMTYLRLGQRGLKLKQPAIKPAGAKV